MQTKSEFYGEMIEPILENLYRMCRDQNIAMLAVFALDTGENDEGNLTVSWGGAHNLEDNAEPPIPMLAAASLLQVPGYGDPDDIEILSQVH